MRFLARLLLAVACLAPAHAAPSSDQQLKDFVKIIRDEASNSAFNPRAQDQFTQEELTRRIHSLVENLETQRASLSVESVADAVRMLPYLFSSTRATEAGEALITSLKAERDVKKAIFRTQVEALLVKASHACLAAVTPADLDEALTSLAPYQRLPDLDARNADPVTLERAGRLFQFVKQWQDYLDARQAGDLNRTTAALGNLRQSVDPSLFVRSRVLALPLQSPLASTSAGTGASVSTAAPAPLDQLLIRLETATLDDLEEIAAEIDARVAENQPGSLLNELRLSIQTIITDRRALAAGQINITLFTHAPLVSRSGAPFPVHVTAILRRLHAQLRDESLRVVFKDSGIIPESGEPADTYIQRVTLAAAAAENWEYALRTLEFYCAFFPGNTAPAWTSRELGSCTTYVTARRLDEAGQFPQAILAYHDALRTAGRTTPLKLISDRLAAIRESRPEAFAAAARLPRPVVYYQPPVPNHGGPAQVQPNTYLVPRAERPLTP